MCWPDLKQDSSSRQIEQTGLTVPSIQRRPGTSLDHGVKLAVSLEVGRNQWKDACNTLKFR